MRMSAQIGSSALAAALLAGPSLAAPEDLKVIAERCGDKTGMTKSACACIAEKAAALKDRQQAMIAAMLLQDVKGGSKIQLDLSMDELAETGQFMASVPMECANG